MTQQDSHSIPGVPGYEILSVVGEGSMGRVYRARQISMDRDVAIKFLPASLASNQRYARQFIQEARTVARLGHLNIVTGIDVGEHEGNYYFVMEFLDGETVGDVLRRGENIEGAEGIVRGTMCEDDLPKAPKSLEVFARFFDVGDQEAEVAQIEENVYGEDLTGPGDVETLMAGLALKLLRHFPLKEGYVMNREGQIVWVCQM